MLLELVQAWFGLLWLKNRDAILVSSFTVGFELFEVLVIS